MKLAFLNLYAKIQNIGFDNSKNQRGLKTVISFVLLFTIFLGVTVKTTAQNEEGLVVRDHSYDDFKSLLGRDISYGYYLSFDPAVHKLNNQEALTLGGRMAWIFNHSFAFGFGGAGFMNTNRFVIENIGQGRLIGGYGGILVEPIVFAKKPLHLSFPILLGAGGVSLNALEDADYLTYQEPTFIADDGFFFVKPGAEIELNLTRSFRISLGAAYLQTTSTHLPGVGRNGFSGFSSTLSFKVGWF